MSSRQRSITLQEAAKIKAATRAIEKARAIEFAKKTPDVTKQSIAERFRVSVNTLKEWLK